MSAHRFLTIPSASIILGVCLNMPASALPGGPSSCGGVEIWPYSIKGPMAIATDGATVIWNINQNVCCLSDAKLAGNADALAKIKPHMQPTNAGRFTPVINPEGALHYETALNWVAALSACSGGKGWLNKSNWQRPVTPQSDVSSEGTGTLNASFGSGCTGDAMSTPLPPGVIEENSPKWGTAFHGGRVALRGARANGSDKWRTAAVRI